MDKIKNPVTGESGGKKDDSHSGALKVVSHTFAQGRVGQSINVFLSGIKKLLLHVKSLKLLNGHKAQDPYH